eukprot:CAMPEP_0205926478 /NCGR_PEP_ID=MMETSP1325-20131115/20559_1 /ASSEMBLY_ACC=CAM_ASM_000708 /TAXON_ID=236786 /ORGANISM="Florenciella sp., Strain RCC1007" /LENGTH=63 /DNA_ID=CAMNT_0053295213 /DNA_START=29 /DNA_END=223 /DNA_ORIENTATION=-
MVYVARATAVRASAPAPSSPPQPARHTTASSNAPEQVHVVSASFAILCAVDRGCKKSDQDYVH